MRGSQWQPNPTLEGRGGLNGGESGIRTHGRLPYTRFPSVRLKPLGHLSRVHRATRRNHAVGTGGEGGIRTHDRFPYTPLAGARLQPLGHLSARPQNIPILRRVSAHERRLAPWGHWAEPGVTPRAHGGHSQGGKEPSARSKPQGRC